MELDSAYRVLGLRPGASAGDIRAAYREQVRIWHPDRYSDGSSLRALAEANMRRVNRAYEILGPDMAAQREERPDSRPCPSPSPFWLADLLDALVIAASRLIPAAVRLDLGSLVDRFRQRRTPEPSPRRRPSPSEGANRALHPKPFHRALRDAMGRGPRHFPYPTWRRRRTRPADPPSDRVEPVPPVHRVRGADRGE